MNMKMASTSTPCRSPIEMLRLQVIILAILCSRAYYCIAFSSYPGSYPLNGGCSNANAATICKYANSDTPSPLRATDRRKKQRRIPRRALPHIKTSSSAEAATKAGYIIRSERTSTVRVDERNRSNRSREERRRPLRTIRRIVHRSDNSNRQGPVSNLEETLLQGKKVESKKQIQVRKAERVTFKATREASRSISNTPASILSPTQRATLTEYMTQPVEDYSLLSFHDEEGPSPSPTSASHKQVTSRRWFVRRLTHEEAGKYIVDPSCSAVKESNLFRLAVPLKPLIGWDLTPVIDLEVIPPDTSDEETSSLDHDIEQSMRSPEEEIRDEGSSSKWRPLKGIRHAVDGARREGAVRPTVKIRSMSVSLLSTKEEVRQLMSKSFRNEDTSKEEIDAKEKDMQVEAIGMVGKVEEFLKPHITFEAELSWQDGTATTKPSVVTVKSSAVTSLTIPRIPNDIIRNTVPSAFLVKRLGATLTSKALEICLPRFLRQLERDYYRWSGIE